MVGAPSQLVVPGGQWGHGWMDGWVNERMDSTRARWLFPVWVVCQPKGAPDVGNSDRWGGDGQVDAGEEGCYGRIQL